MTLVPCQQTDPDNADELQQRRDLTRERRFMSNKKRYAWPKAIVPFDFDMPDNSTGAYVCVTYL